MGIFSFLDLENGQLIFSIEELQGWIDEVLVILDTEIKSGKEESIFLRTTIGRLLERLIDGRDVALLPEDILKFIENNLKDDWIKKGFIKELKYPWLPRVKTKEVDEGGMSEGRQKNMRIMQNFLMINCITIFLSVFLQKLEVVKKRQSLKTQRKKAEYYYKREISKHFTCLFCYSCPIREILLILKIDIFFVFFGIYFIKHKRSITCRLHRLLYNMANLKIEILDICDLY